MSWLDGKQRGDWKWTRMLFTSKPIPRVPPAVVRLDLLKVSLSPRTMLPAGSHVFKYADLCITFHLQITTGTENKSSNMLKGEEIFMNLRSLDH